MDGLTAAGVALERRMLWEGRNAGPALLFDAWYGGTLTIDDLRGLLPVVWSMAENPCRHMTVDVWIDLFGTVGPPPLTDGAPLTVYRGATWPRRRGMSWTEDPDQARWYANRFADHRGAAAGQVFRCQVPPGVVLAVIDGCREGETEVVVDPKRLPSLTRSTIVSPG